MRDVKNCNIAFFDAEFTARSERDRGIPEMIQCAFLIHKVAVSNDGSILCVDSMPLRTYTTFVQPVYAKQLSKYIQDLTGITQESVDNGQVFKEVIDTVYDLIKRYDVKMIVTWGPDRGMLKKNFYFCDYDRKRVDEILRLFEDVSFKVSQGYGYKYPISQSKMCEILNVKENGFHHDAYDDALNLSKIVKAICDK
jgi:inhibitor of KinA sporulation pathway (predicted exonuclease)